MHTKPQIYLCAGGTGGHLFPAIATARALFFERGITGTVVLSDKRVSDPQITSMHMPLPRRSPRWKLPRFIYGLIRNFIQCVRLFKKTQPELVVGFGGYASVPAVLAAQFLKIPTLLHEQNAVFGRANRILRYKADLIATSFAKTQHVTRSTPHIMTGNPVRLDPCTPYMQKDQNQGMTLLVVGGSQGASIFSTLIPLALALLTADEQAHITVYQQCRAELLKQTQTLYDTLPLKHVTLTPFFEDMPTLYEHADCVISRAGASTVSELITANRPAFFIPYPLAMDDHQFYNAKILRDQGAAQTMRQSECEATPEILTDFVRSVLRRDHTIHTMAQKLLRLRTDKAASSLAHVCQDLLPQD